MWLVGMEALSVRFVPYRTLRQTTRYAVAPLKRERRQLIAKDA